jgi:hypothetical protein
VRQVADLLENDPRSGVPLLRRRMAALMARMNQAACRSRKLGPALRHFLKVTRSYQPHLFACYEVPDLPRTNNDLEHLFGSHRYHERRATGRKVASPSLVLRGSVRLIAAATTRLRPREGSELALRQLGPWIELRTSLATRRQTRVLRYRFRKDPRSYLAAIERHLLQRGLPA